MDSLETEVLESYFKRYFPSAKLYRTYGGQDVFFHEVAEFLLEVACVNTRHYRMPKQRLGFIITRYDGSKVDWGYITGVALREHLRGV